MPEKTYTQRLGAPFAIADPRHYIHESRRKRGVTEEEWTAAERIRDHEVQVLDFYRRLMDWLGFYKHCPRKACRRGEGCRTAEVDCFWPAESWLRQNVYPELRVALRKRLAEKGYNAERPLYDPEHPRQAATGGSSAKGGVTP